MAYSSSPLQWETKECYRVWGVCNIAWEEGREEELGKVCKKNIVLNKNKIKNIASKTELVEAFSLPPGFY